MNPLQLAPNVTHYLILRTASGGYRLKGLAKEWPSLLALVVHLTALPEILPCVLRMPALIGMGSAHGPGRPGGGHGAQGVLAKNAQKGKKSRQSAQGAQQGASHSLNPHGGQLGLGPVSGKKQTSGANAAPPKNQHNLVRAPNSAFTSVVPNTNTSNASNVPGGGANGGNTQHLTNRSNCESVNCNFVADDLDTSMTRSQMGDEVGGSPELLAGDGALEECEGDGEDTESDYHRLKNFSFRMSALRLANANY